MPNPLHAPHAPPARRDVIVAPATPPGPAARAVLRLSGPGLLARAEALLPPGCPPPGAARGAVHGELEWSPGCRVEVELLVFPGPASATGEDVVELHLPGSEPVVAGVLAWLRAHGARLAEPGEFTRRAFLSGRIDLAQAEAVLDLVAARTAAGAAAAAEVLAGGLGASSAAAREAVAEALAQLEAGLDFEEGDAQDLRPGEIEPLLAAARAALAEGLAGEERRLLEPQPWRIALRGAPNAGKSALFRRLTGRSALVSAAAGTTRDRLEAPWLLEAGGEPCLLLDGPGLGGAAADPRDAAARVRVRGEEDQVDLWWLLLDASDPPETLPEAPREAPAFVVWSKTDLPNAVPAALAAQAAARAPMVRVSSVTGAGLDELAARTREALEELAGRREARRGAGLRHRAALSAALEALDHAVAMRRAGEPAELTAEELRAALVALGELVGALTPEDLLDRIFARFCLGK